jgi:hypothetical protein
MTHPFIRRDKKKTARRAAFPQPAGRFTRVWQVLGSNQRRLSRRFYRPLSSHPSHTSADQHIHAARQDTGTPPSAIRPCTRGSRETRTGHGQEIARPRTARPGNGHAGRPPGSPALQPLRRRQDRWRGSADYGTSTSSCYPGAPSIQARPRGMRRFRSAPRSSSQADQRCRTGGAVRAAGGVTCLR